jgi:hypothetical protein
MAPHQEGPFNGTKMTRTHQNAPNSEFESPLPLWSNTELRVFKRLHPPHSLTDRRMSEPAAVRIYLAFFKDCIGTRQVIHTGDSHKQRLIAIPAAV